MSPFLTLTALALAAPPAARPSSPTTPSEAPVKAPRADLKKTLTAEQYRVTQECGTEPPFRNAYWDNHEAGLYLDVVSGEVLFSSLDKFDSGSGWPSFTRPLEPNVVERADDTHGMTRVEVRSKGGDSHLGHVFDDGPKAQGGLRYCINSAALRFVPVARLEAEGLGRYLPLFNVRTEAKEEVAVLAGGCFWGMQEILRGIPGVLRTEVGYTGGTLAHPRYEDTHDGRSGHAEAVKVTFDPSRLSYETLLEKWFFKMHDPTTLNRQGNDVGTQYRSAIFVADAEQRRVAEAVTKRVDASGAWKRPVTTSIEPVGPWWPAEAEHQDYLQKHPGGYSCHYMRE